MRVLEIHKCNIYKIKSSGELIAIVQKPALNIKLEKQFRSTPSTEKVLWFYVEDDTMGTLFGLDVKHECGFFILKFKMASKMAAKK